MIIARNNLEKHITITSSSEVQEICKPFFQQFHLNFFTYFRVYKDGSRTVLTNNGAFIKWAFGNNIVCDLYPCSLDNIPQGQIFTISLPISK